MDGMNSIFSSWQWPEETEENFSQNSWSLDKS